VFTYRSLNHDHLQKTLITGINLGDFLPEFPVSRAFLHSSHAPLTHAHLLNASMTKFA